MAERKDKTHYMPPENWKAAMIFRRETGFWNPAMTEAGNPCGLEPHRLTANRRKVTCGLCKRYLKRKPEQRGGKNG